jgi:hypothetical protein
MTFEEYKHAILLHLETARDCEEVEKIVTHSIQKMQEKHLPSTVITDYLRELRRRLQELSPNDFDPVHWCNIRSAIIYLKNYH